MKEADVPWVACGNHLSVSLSGRDERACLQACRCSELTLDLLGMAMAESLASLAGVRVLVSRWARRAMATRTKNHHPWRPWSVEWCPPWKQSRIWISSQRPELAGGQMARGTSTFWEEPRLAGAQKATDILTFLEAPEPWRQVLL